MNFGVKPVPTILFLGIYNLFLRFKDFLPKNFKSTLKTTWFGIQILNTSLLGMYVLERNLFPQFYIANV